MVCQDYWKNVWQCVGCKTTQPLNKVKSSQIVVSSIKDHWMKCRKCGDEMKKTIMREEK